MRTQLPHAAVLAALALAAHALPAASQEAPDGGPARLRQRALAATCAACHGSDGHAPADAAIPALAGRPADWLVAKVRSFRAATAEPTAMHRIARGYDDAQLAQLAAWFAAQQP